MGNFGVCLVHQARTIQQGDKKHIVRFTPFNDRRNFISKKKKK